MKYELSQVILAFSDLSEERGPTVRELMSGASISSSATAQYYIYRMWEEGLIEPLGLKSTHLYASRGYRLTSQGKAMVRALRHAGPI